MLKSISYKSSMLRVEDLSKHYKNNTFVVKAVDQTNFSVAKGEFVGIIGPSGSGKSTLLNLIGGLDKPDCGRIFVRDKDITQMNDEELSHFRRFSIGIVFQSYNLVEILSVRENIIISSELAKEPIDEKFLLDLVTDLGIENKLDMYPYQLSGGQQQRVAIARALFHKPEIILADEPTGNLDSKTGLEVLKLLKQTISKYNQTLIMITHNEENIKGANRIFSIVDGRLEETVNMN